MNRLAWLVFIVSMIAQPASAQLNTQHVKGSAGRKAGSQPPPAGYIVAPLLYFYSADTVRNRNGEKVPFVLTDDEIPGIPGVLIRGKNRSFALGPDATLAIARGNRVYGFARMCYQWETYARTTTQGGAWNISVTLLLRPLTVPSP
jgi:hypothetical protein